MARGGLARLRRPPVARLLRARADAVVRIGVDVGDVQEPPLQRPAGSCGRGRGHGQMARTRPTARGLEGTRTRSCVCVRKRRGERLLRGRAEARAGEREEEQREDRAGLQHGEAVATGRSKAKRDGLEDEDEEAQRSRRRSTI